jgi:hypothetical protein
VKCAVSNSNLNGGHAHQMMTGDLIQRPDVWGMAEKRRWCDSTEGRMKWRVSEMLRAQSQTIAA